MTDSKPARRARTGGMGTASWSLALSADVSATWAPSGPLTHPAVLVRVLP